MQEEGSKGGAVVRALASHQCGPGSNPGVDAICRLSSCYERFFSRYGFPLFLKTVLQNSNYRRNPSFFQGWVIICKESIQLTMIKSRNQQNKKSPTCSLFFFIEIRARLEAFFFKHYCSSSFSVLFYFNNIFWWLKLGLLFSRPAVSVYLGSGPLGREHVKRCSPCSC